MAIQAGISLPFLLLCKSFRGVSASVSELQDLQQFVGDATGSMPVCYVNHFEKYRSRPQRGKIYGSLSVMPPAAYRFVM